MNGNKVHPSSKASAHYRNSNSSAAATTGAPIGRPAPLQSDSAAGCAGAKSVPVLPQMIGAAAAAAAALAASPSSSGLTPGAASLVGAGASAADSAAHNMELASLFECPCALTTPCPLCPSCRGPLANIRNLAMERLAAQVQFPCKYASNGCLAAFHHTAKAEHEEICEFRPYVCPCPGASCKWQGSLENVMQHLTQQHKSITTLQGEDIIFLATDINLPGAVDWVMMQNCFGYHFMLVLEKQERMDSQVMFYAIVQLIGTRKQAEQFAYRLELNGQRRRLTWEATPRSIHDGVHAAIANSDCLVFDSNIASLFAETGNLGISVTISMAAGAAVATGSLNSSSDLPQQQQQSSSICGQGMQIG
uniref:E3 ubiquitin-protein ligase n=1 Tax=Macrostomum lignano TaxID=282301 RepID=A0A1I8JCP3_9PLAT